MNYCVQWLYGYLGMGVNQYERNWFETPEDAKAFVRELESNNAKDYKTFHWDGSNLKEVRL